MNPCVDCRVFMLRGARDFGEQIGASFFITGEVLDQRPLSQTRARFPLIDREAGLEGFVLRPLSALHLPPTVPEQEGVVDRARLLAIRGRSRRTQYVLARHWGITDFGQPAGGCLLTDLGYSARLRDLWEHDSAASVPDIQLLRVGRHFRLSPGAKAIVGRNESENMQILALARDGDALLELRDAVGPTTLVRGAWTDGDLALAAAMTVRYGDTTPPAVVRARVIGGTEREIIGGVIAPQEIEALRIGVCEGSNEERFSPQPFPAGGEPQARSEV
jgi:tRNA U34 2-thiouridine synthase MnmA/TrmU